MATFLNRALPFAFLGVVLVAWEAAARSGRWSKLLFPSLENIFRELGLFFTKTEMLSEVLVSLERALGGFALAAAGTTIRRSAAAREAPMFAADHSSTRLTPRAPWLVTMTIGYRHSRNTSATFDRLPMPKTKMKMGNSASFGTA